MENKRRIVDAKSVGESAKGEPQSSQNEIDAYAPLKRATNLINNIPRTYQIKKSE